MGVINVSAGSEAVLKLGASEANVTPTSSDGVTVPAMQDIVLNNSTGVFRWKQLNLTSESAVTTPSTNQITLNLVVDPDTFFGTGSGDAVKSGGLYGASKNKTKVYFSAFFNGTDSTSKYITGSGYISGLAPTVNMDAPVWVTPVTIEVDGDFSAIQTVA
tara:strand:- start:1230 stop:1709 length:480 start_codon:yes stop_codon:yes gene_type:complete